MIIFAGIKLILDFVPNHSSDEHEWFVKSVNKEDKYADYYVWYNGTWNGTHNIPPNNWVGLVHITLWEVLHYGVCKLKSIQLATCRDYATCNTKLNQHKQRKRVKSGKGGGDISDKERQMKGKN